MVTGFSQLHDDGTGGGFSLSNFKLWPMTCETFETCVTPMYTRKLTRALNPDGTPQDAGSPGYFASNLSNGIQAEMTATRRTALHRYTFPASGAEGNLPTILLDLKNDGQVSGMNCKLSVNADNGRMKGGARFLASFGVGTYVVLFAVYLF